LAKTLGVVLLGPEEPCGKGIHACSLSREEVKHIAVIGPQQLGAQLEGSKDFSKEFMVSHNIPTAAYKSFNQENLEEGLSYLETQNLPIVLKADGLAAGKGVLICERSEEHTS